MKLGQQVDDQLAFAPGMRPPGIGRSGQAAFSKAWLTLRATGSALSLAIFCPSAVSSLVCSLSASNCFLACDVHSSRWS